MSGRSTTGRYVDALREQYPGVGEAERVAIISAMKFVLHYDEENLRTGVVVIDEDYLTARELLREKAGWL